MFNLIYDRDGRVEKIEYLNQYLPYDPKSKTFDESDPLTVKLREWELENNVDLIAWSERELEGELVGSSDTFIVRDLARLKRNKQQEIIELAYQAQNKLVADYAPPEQVTWERKLSEAIDFLKNQNLDSVPTLKTEAAKRTSHVPGETPGTVSSFSNASTVEKHGHLTCLGRPQAPCPLFDAVEALAKKIVFKSKQLYRASATIAGIRALALQGIANAETVEEINRIRKEVNFEIADSL